jgi:hypothetical protein
MRGPAGPPPAIQVHVSQFGGAIYPGDHRRVPGKEDDVIKFSCSMVSGSDIFYATLIAEDSKQAKEMAAAETKKGRPREWNVAVLEAEVAGPARFLGSGAQDA